MIKEIIKVLLLEGVHERALENFAGHDNFEVEYHKGALDEDELCAKIPEVGILGLRSKTQITKKVLEKADNLLAIGTFCIGTNQVDLETAKRQGAPVFNSPFSNTRSVAELVIAEIIMLARGIPEKNWFCHEGKWLKSAERANEIRGKTLGIIGYGHIGSQISVLAESLGIRVCFYDAVKKLAIGNAQECESLECVLKQADFVSLHVPAIPETENMFDKKIFAQMKDGACLINASRGNVVVIDDLVESLESGKLSGAGIDVFPEEPSHKDEEFRSKLRGIKNVILTPHIGGSTQEAQENIGLDVSDKLIRYCQNGSTIGAVNFASVTLPATSGATQRFAHIHKNVPGMLEQVNRVFSGRGINIASQYLKADNEISYVVVDIENNLNRTEELFEDLKGIEGTVRVRVI